MLELIKKFILPSKKMISHIYLTHVHLIPNQSYPLNKKKSIKKEFGGLSGKYCEKKWIIKKDMKYSDFWSTLFSLIVWACAQSLSRVRLFAAPWAAPHQAPLPKEFSRQEYRTGIPFTTPGDLSDPGIKPSSHVSCTGWQSLEH